MSVKVEELNDDNFNEAIGANSLLVVDFWAPWCRPCLAIAPIIDDLADHYGDQVKFTKVNTEASELVSRSQGIRSLPTIRVFKNGSLAAERVGMCTRSQLSDMIDDHI